MRKMKDSKISYIGKIPYKWKVGKYKFFSKSRMGETILKSNTDEQGIPIYSATSDDSIFGYLKKPKLILKKGDIVIPARGTIGKATYIYDDFATCTQTSICSYNIKINSKYLYYTILAMNSEWFHSEKTSVPLITVEQLNNVYITIPCKKEQEKIVEFLDEKVYEINKIIEKTKETIEDYKKYKQSVVTKAVTKGIEEKIKYKNSQIDWIGEIPKEWDIIKIRYLGTLQNGISAEATKFGDGYPFANYGDIYNNYNLPSKLSGLINSNEKERENYSIKRGDIFFTRTSETIEEVGLSCVAEKDFINACFSGFIIRFRPNNDSMLPEFYKYYFRSDIHRKYLVKEMNMVTRASLGQDLLKNMPVLIPNLQEQREIAQYLDNKCKEIDKLLKLQENLIYELENYKKSLIYEYVTGKKEVAKDVNYSAEDISNWILNKNLENRKNGKETAGITNLKLQKLLYYASGIYFLYKKCNLIKEDFVAWKHGPIIKQIYYKYNSNGAKEIQHNRKSKIEIDKETQEILEKMYSKYSQYTAEELRNMTHQERPWRKTSRNKIIEKDLIKDYFENEYKWEQ